MSKLVSQNTLKLSEAYETGIEVVQTLLNSLGIKGFTLYFDKNNACINIDFSYMADTEAVVKNMFLINQENSGETDNDAPTQIRY